MATFTLPKNSTIGQGQVFKADMGAEAFYEILRSMDMETEAKRLWHEIRTTKSKQRKKNKRHQQPEQ